MSTVRIGIRTAPKFMLWRASIPDPDVEVTCSKSDVIMRSSNGFPILEGVGGGYSPQICNEDSTWIIPQSKEVVPPASDGVWEDYVAVAGEGSIQQSRRLAYSLRTPIGGDVKCRILLALTCFCSAFIFHQFICAGMIHSLSWRC